MSEKRMFRLVHEEARRRAAEFCLNAPLGWIVRVSPETRSLEQNAMLWACLTDLSEQVNWHGNKLTAEEWKDVCSAALKRQKVVPGIDGGFVVCGQRTSQMTKTEFRDLLEVVMAFGSQQGVHWSDEPVGVAA